MFLGPSVFVRRSCDEVGSKEGFLRGVGGRMRTYQAVPTRKGADAVIEFLAWWAAASIVVGSGLTAWMVHLNFRAH